MKAIMNAFLKIEVFPKRPSFEIFDGEPARCTWPIDGEFKILNFVDAGALRWLPDLSSIVHDRKKQSAD